MYIVRVKKSPIATDQMITELSTGHFSWTRPDPTRRNVDPTRPAIGDKKSDPTRLAARLFIHMYILWFNNYLIIIWLLYIKYRRESINPNVVFEDWYRFRYQKIISKKLENPKCWPDPTRPAKIRQNRDPTRPDPRVHPSYDPWTTLDDHKANEYII